jgi:hypothetical protein
VRAGDRGARFRFRFCPVCGTNVFHTEEGVEDGVGVAVGAFAEPTFPAPATRSTIAGATRGSGYRRARRRSSGTRCEGAMKIIPRSRRRARKHSPSEVIVRGGGRGHVARARQDVQ